MERAKTHQFSNMNFILYQACGARGWVASCAPCVVAMSDSDLGDEQKLDTQTMFGGLVASPKTLQLRPSDLRGWTQVPIAQAAGAQIPQPVFNV